MSIEESKKEIRERRRTEKKRMEESRTEVIQDAKEVDNGSIAIEERPEKKSKKKSKKRQRDAEGEQLGEDKDDSKENTGTTEENKRKKRKSVSFAEKVDVRDIEEGNHTGVPGQDGNIEVVNPDEQSKEQRKREKRAKREQRRKSSSISSDTNKVDKKTPDSGSTTDHSVIAYLSQYHHDRASWKFQKIREAQLLKNVFSIEQVPPQYNPALLAYLKGLKSEGARTRLRKGAQDVIKTDERMTTATSETQESGNDATTTTTDEASSIAKLPVLPESWREEYGNAVYRFKGNLNAGVKDLNEGVTLAAPAEDGKDKDEMLTNTLTRLEIRKRAEMVLWTVSGKIGKNLSSTKKSDRTETETEVETPESESLVSNTKEDKKKAPARKKRKNRTMIVDISSSSESSDSDSD